MQELFCYLGNFEHFKNLHSNIGLSKVKQGYNNNNNNNNNDNDNNNSNNNNNLSLGVKQISASVSTLSSLANSAPYCC